MPRTTRQKSPRNAISFREPTQSKKNKLKVFKKPYYDRMNESVSLRSNVLTSNHDLQNALYDTKAMAYAFNELQSQVLYLKQPKISMTTPRSIIVNKLLNPPLSTAKDSRPPMPIQIQMAKDLKATLDREMGANEALYIYTKFEDWLGTEALQSVILVTCCVCQKVRFRQAAGFSKPRPLNEFIDRDLRLGCQHPVCSTCFLKSIFSSLARLRETWWKARSLEICLPCPCGCSPAGVHINDRSSLLQVLQYLGNEKAEFSVIRIYDTILQLMQSLYFVEPPLTSKARKVAARLHFSMMKNGLMHSPFDERYRRQTRSEAGSPLKADFNHVELYNIDEGRKTLQVPIFAQLLRTEKTPIDCVICAESIHNVSYDAVDEWIEVCVEFDGDWVWKISRFPKILRARCKHTINFCTSCLQKHIGSQLEQLGKSACDSIRCPSQTCQRLLTYEEVQLYAKQETFAQ
ncbi:uncharacterized protein LW94_10459 [Fusarium fujikuroi]|nr:uncharacterized protein LW94_10459 [Fusarium fujikuroi]